MKTVRTTILLDADLLDRLERHVRRQRTTKTSVIGAAIETWLDSHEATPEFPFLGIGRSQHGRLFPPQDLGLLEAPDRDDWQRPQGGGGRTMIIEGGRAAIRAVIVPAPRAAP